MLKKIIIGLCLMASFFIWSGCGGYEAPIGSTVTVTPSDLTIAALSGDTIYDFSVFVANSNGVPLNNVELFISGPFATPRVPARYQFFKQLDGVEPINSGFTAKTNEQGVYEFSIRVFAMVGGIASEFADFIHIQAASASSLVEITLGETAS